MTDARTTDLARRYRATNDPEDGARLLAERLRAGTLSLTQVVLAKRLGDPAAAAVLPGAPRPVPARPGPQRSRPAPHLRTIVRRIQALVGRDRRAAVLVALAAARHAGGTGPVLAAAEAWLACPCQAHAAPAVGRALREPPAVTVTGTPGGVERAVWALAAALVSSNDGEAVRLAVEAARAAAFARGPRVRCRSCSGPWSWPCSCDRQTIGRPDAPGVLAAIDAAVRAWALAAVR